MLAVDLVLAVEAVGRLGARLQPRKSDRILAAHAQAVTIASDQIERLLYLPQPQIEPASRRGRHVLLLDRVHSCQSPDRFIEIHRPRAVAGGGEAASYSATLGRYTTDGILDFNNAHENTVFSGKAALRLDDRTRVRLSGRWGQRAYHFPTDFTGAAVDENQFTFADESSLSAEVERHLGNSVRLRALVTTFGIEGGTDDAPDGPADTLGFYGFQVTTGDYLLEFEGDPSRAGEWWDDEPEAASASVVSVEEGERRRANAELSKLP